MQTKSTVIVFQTLQVLSWNLRGFLKLRARKFHLLKYNTFFQSVFFFFHFSSSESYFFKYKVRQFHFPKYKKVLFSKKFRFEGWGRKVRWVATFIKNSIIDAWQWSEYASGSEYTRFINMLLALNMPGFWIYLSRNIRKAFLKKI